MKEHEYTDVHVSMSVRGALNQDKRTMKRTARSCLDANGKPYTAETFREALYDMLSKGYEMVPAVGCDNFDPKTGCRGHKGRKG